jgi:hypothetical protein
MPGSNPVEDTHPRLQLQLMRTQVMENIASEPANQVILQNRSLSIIYNNSVKRLRFGQDE